MVRPLSSRADDTIEFCLSHKGQIQAAIMEARMGAGGRGHTGGVGSGHCRVSDPTALQAIRALSPVESIDVPFGPYIAGVRERVHLRHPEKWLAVVSAVEQRFLAGNGLTLDARFYKSRYLDGDLWRRTCDKLRITHGTYYAYRQDVLNHAALYAVKYGLAEPTEHGLRII